MVTPQISARMEKWDELIGSGINGLYSVVFVIVAARRSRSLREAAQFRECFDPQHVDGFGLLRQLQKLGGLLGGQCFRITFGD